MKNRKIGNISNYYGGLNVMEYEGKYYWCIDDWSTDFKNIEHWREIDKELYDSLIAYEGRLKKEV